jgi:hypothetical protein
MIRKPEEQREVALLLAEDIFGRVHCITQGDQQGAYTEVWHCRSGAIVKLTFVPVDGLDHIGEPAIALHAHVTNTTNDQGRHYIERWQRFCTGDGWLRGEEEATA